MNYYINNFSLYIVKKTFFFIKFSPDNDNMIYVKDFYNHIEFLTILNQNHHSKDFYIVNDLNLSYK